MHMNQVNYLLLYIEMYDERKRNDSIDPKNQYY